MHLTENILVILPRAARLVDELFILVLFHAICYFNEKSDSEAFGGTVNNLQWIFTISEFTSLCTVDVLWLLFKALALALVKCSVLDLRCSILSSSPFGVVKSRGEDAHHSWLSFRVLASNVSALTKPAEITITDYAKDDYQYEEVTC